MIEALSLSLNVILIGVIVYHRTALKGVRGERDGFAQMKRAADWAADMAAKSS